MSKIKMLLNIKGKYFDNKENLYKLLSTNRAYLPRFVSDLVKLPSEKFFTLKVFEALHDLLPSVFVLRDNQTYIINYEELAEVIKGKKEQRQKKLDRIESDKMVVNFESQLELELLSSKQANGDHPLAGDLYNFLYNADTLMRSDLSEIQEHLEFCKKCQANIEKLKYIYGQ
ncbi:hypothetical protein [Mucilaginibacter pedocola]|uniref:Uncharacterized protein n=1 Tax=Mucilaginibacter pedocola TaxID=1792845 RepID=A0A1S9PMK9_9SPHI|nr:hypothetical protein [Mucilaginibacter pedocola]OOQ62193.1 hypothetical protein BC343_03880 [Mucilaginibacter pedocola]